MRTPALAALTMVTALATGGAQAQRLGSYPGASYPVPSAQADRAYPAQGYPTQGYPTPGYPDQAYPGVRPQVGRPAPQRWVRDGSGRWYGGTNAPGGWNAYRRPTRGYRLPHYWTSDSFFIADFAGYGLAPPPEGYGWHRYYDDAVLTDRHGRVYDWAGGINWDGGYGAGGGGYASSGYAYAEGGRGGPGAGYAQSLPSVVERGGVTTYSTSGGYVQGGAYATGGYQVGPGTTVVTIQGEPSVTTTTTTEYVEETRSHYVRRAPVRHYYRPVRYSPVRTCGCRVAAPVRHRVWHRPPVEQPIQGS